MLKSDRSDKSARRLHLHPYGDCTETDKNVEYDNHVFFFSFERRNFDFISKVDDSLIKEMQQLLRTDGILQSFLRKNF